VRCTPMHGLLGDFAGAWMGGVLLMCGAPPCTGSGPADHHAQPVGWWCAAPVQCHPPLRRPRCRALSCAACRMVKGCSCEAKPMCRNQGAVHHHAQPDGWLLLLCSVPPCAARWWFCRWVGGALFLVLHLSECVACSFWWCRAMYVMIEPCIQVVCGFFLLVG